MRAHTRTHTHTHAHAHAHAPCTVGHSEWHADRGAVLFHQPSQALRPAVCRSATPHDLQPLLLHLPAGPVLVSVLYFCSIIARCCQLCSLTPPPATPTSSPLCWAVLSSRCCAGAGKNLGPVSMRGLSNVASSWQSTECVSAEHRDGSGTPAPRSQYEDSREALVVLCPWPMRARHCRDHVHVCTHPSACTRFIDEVIHTCAAAAAATATTTASHYTFYVSNRCSMNFLCADHPASPAMLLPQRQPGKVYVPPCVCSSVLPTLTNQPTCLRAAAAAAAASTCRC
eukprot:1161815-Pelagomonas_calceolata.AAC.5